MGQNEIAAEIGKVLGITVRYEQVEAASCVNDILTGGVYKKDLKKDNPNLALDPGANFLTQHLEEVSLDHKNGLFGGTTDVISSIGKTQPLTVEQFVQKRKDAFKPAVAV